MPTARDPLPRSLRPLPDESLPGFLLRMAHRLDLTPDQVALRVGLTTPKYAHAKVSASHLLMMDEARLKDFSRVARITPEEADSLTLRSYSDRYPALTQMLPSPGKALRPRKEPWVLRNHSRYCPRCLAGDGTPIQNLHGGPWKRQWRLGFVFACLQHQAFLLSDCPRCCLPALGGRLGSSVTLLPTPNTPRLHPAQCRNPVGNPEKREICGHRLDTSEPETAALPHDMANLQAVLLDLLVGDTPSDLASQRFANLQVAVSMIQAGWPVAADLVPTQAHAPLEAHLAAQPRSTRRTRPTAEATSRQPGTPWNTPPDSALATAGVLLAAYHLLAQEPSGPRSTLPQLLRHLPTRDDLRWGRTWHTLAREASPSLRRQIDQVYRHRLSPEWIRQGAPTLRPSKANTTQKIFSSVNNLTGLEIAAEHIPQFLPVSWLSAAIFEDPESIIAARRRRLRRVLPVHLVQAISNLNFLEAAAFLGIPTSWSTQDRLRIQPLAPFQDLKDRDLPATLRRLAQHIVGGKRIDYQARRTEFSGWILDDKTWDDLCQHKNSLTGRKPTRRTREAASAFVWSRVTKSEFSLAPVFQPPIWHTDRALRSEIPHLELLRRWDQKQAPIPYPGLLAALESHAMRLIKPTVTQSDQAGA
ncbi:TniQ family protein [Streptomyces sp. NPDC046985]|uniref:TniQ family protein n=1 Tax=Streptomyces sp. NPDC046985 TaxID=3155377 RepID=UPI00340730FE